MSILEQPDWNTNVQRINAHYLYETGWKIHSVHDIRPSNAGHDSQPLSPEERDWAFDTWKKLTTAKEALEVLFSGPIFKLKTITQAYNELSAQLNTCRATVLHSDNSFRCLPLQDYLRLTAAVDKFEHVLQAELGTGDYYALAPKGAYDMTILATNGIQAFPPLLRQYGMDVIYDATEAMRCIAFELWTASAFHLHRIVEAILGKYWDHVSNNAGHPKNKAIGPYLEKMEKDKNNLLGTPEVRSALRDLKNLHRNPIIHPQKKIEDEHQAIALFNAVYTVLNQMLREMNPAQGISTSGILAPVLFANTTP